MSFVDYVKNGFKILGFSKEAIGAITADDESKKHSLLLTAIIAAFYALAFSAVNSYFGVAPVSFSIGMVFAIFVGIFLALLISCGILHLIARLFGGNASIFQMYAVYASTVVPLILLNLVVHLTERITAVYVLLSIVLFIYGFVLTVFMIRETYVISTLRAFFVVVIPVLILFILLLVFLFAFFAVLTGAGIT